MNAQQFDADFLRPIADWHAICAYERAAHYMSARVNLAYHLIDLTETEWLALHTRRFFLTPPDHRRISVLQGQGIMVPHHSVRHQCELNVYLSADAGDITTGFRADEGAEPVIVGSATAQAWGQDNRLAVWSPKDLTPVRSIHVTTGEAWLMDLTHIHSVIKHTTEPRVAITYQWNTASWHQIRAEIAQVQAEHRNKYTHATDSSTTVPTGDTASSVSQ